MPVSPKRAGKTGSFLSLAAIFISLTGFAISGNSIPPLITTISSEISSSFESFGFVIMLQFLFFTLASFVGGWLAEHHGVPPSTLVIIGIIIITVCFFTGPLFTGIIFFVFWAIPLGFGGGLIETFSTILVSRFEKPGSSKLMNLSQSFFTLGAVIAPQTVSLALGAGMGWRTIFILFALFMAAVALFFLFFYRATPENPKYPVINRNKREPFFDLFKNPWFLLFSLSMFIYVAVESTLASWTPAYFEKVLGLSASSAAWRMSVFWGGVMAGRLLTMVLPDRWTLWPSIILGGIGMAIGIGLMAITRNPGAATVFVGFTGLLSGPVWPSTVSICQDRFRNQRFTSGVIGLGALGVSTGPFLASLIIRHIGFSMVYPIFTFVTIILAGFYIFITLLSRRKSGGEHSPDRPRKEQ